MIKIFIKFRNFVTKNKLIENGDKVLLSFSGGPDSTALALLLRKLQKYIDFEITLFYFNHNLRDDSEEEERIVREFAKRFDFELFIKKLNFANRESNIEERAREIRYKELLKKVNEKGFTKIATAHTLDDQIETFLIRLIRGSGSKGLMAIPLIRDNVIVRPLLEIRKREILEYLKALGIGYVEDKTNRETKLLRNKVRNILIPLLEESFNPAIVKILNNEIKILTTNESYIEENACKIKDKIIRGEKLNIKLLKKEHPAIINFLIREYIKDLRGSLRRITYSHIRAISELKNGQKAFIPAITLIREYDFILPYVPNKIKYYEYSVDKIPFKLHINEIKKGFELRIVEQNKDFDDRKRAHLDYDKIKFPIKIRKRKEGDRYFPLGMGGKSKKIKDIFNDMKIPKRERDLMPVFTDSEGEILWVLGLRINDKFKVDSKTKRILLIEKL